MEPDKKSNGAFIGAVIVIILIVIGAIYMWNKNTETQNTTEPNNAINEVSEDATVINAYEELNLLEEDANAIGNDTGAFDQVIQ